MSDIYELSAESRQDVGKGASRRLRRTDKIPAVIYGTGGESKALTMDHNQVIKALRNEAFYSHILTINVDGKKEKAVLKDLQRHPYKPKVLHMDFQRISDKEKIQMRVPLHFIGGDVAPGVKEGGGIVSHLVNEVEISCLPKDLPEFIDVDISQLELDQTLHLTDLKLPKGAEIVTLMHNPDNNQPVVNIHVPRVAPAEEEIEAPAAEGEDEAAETEEKKEQGSKK